MLSTAIIGSLIAISFAAPPGPVAIETIRRGLRGGFRPALRVQLGSIIGDLTWCLAALVGLAPLVQIAFIRAVVGVIGIALLVYFGVMGIRDAARQSSVNLQPDRETKPGAFRAGAAMALANPMAVGYWISVGGIMISRGIVDAGADQTAAFIAGFIVGMVLWAFAMAFAVRWGKKSLNPAAFRVVTFACGAIMLIFGVSLASQMFTSLL